MKRMNLKNKQKTMNIIKLFPVLLPFVVFSQISDYAYQRKINKPEKEKFYSVVLSPEIVARLKSSWNDIRIISFSEKDTTEIPYLLECIGNKNEEKVVPFTLINKASEKDYSYLTLKINEKATLNRIKLAITTPEFYEWVNI